MSPKSSLYSPTCAIGDLSFQSLFCIFLLHSKEFWLIFFQVSKRKLVHLSIPSSFSYFQANFWSAGYHTCTFSPRKPFLCQVPAIHTCTHTHQHVSQELKCLWEMSDLLRLICTCTKSPVCPQFTTFTGSNPFHDIWATPGFAGFTGHPCSSTPVCLPAKLGYLPLGGTTKHRSASLKTNHPSSQRDPKAGMVWCLPVMHWCCLSSSAGENTRKPHHSNLIFKARVLTLVHNFTLWQ